MGLAVLGFPVTALTPIRQEALHESYPRHDPARVQAVVGASHGNLEVVRQLHNVPFEAGLPRVYTVLKLDERMDKPTQTLEDKVKSVEDQLGRVGEHFRRDRSIF